VLTILQQAVEDGRMTDGKGRTVDFRNTILIMTSNIASEYILEHAGETTEALHRQVDQELHQVFKPEFLNRLDDQIIFNSLGREEILRIVDLQLDRLQGRIADRRMRIDVSGEAKQLLADQGFDPAFGARPLKRAIQQKVLDPLALELLEGRIKAGDVVRVEVDQDRVVLRAGTLANAESP